MASPSMNHWINKHLSRLQFGLFLERLAEWLTGYLFIFGTVVLIVKRLMPQFWPHVLWLGVGAIPVAWIAWKLSRRKAYQREDSVAMLDNELNAGGLLMTLSEAPNEQWEEQLPRVEQIWKNSLPKVRPVRFTKFLILPMLFALGSSFIPLKVATPEPIIHNAVSRDAAKQLSEMLVALDEQEVLEEEEKKELREEIEKLAEETKNQPLTHEKWETVDSLQQRLQMRLETRRMEVAKAKSAAAKLAKAGRSEVPLSLDESQKLEKELLDALKKLFKKSPLGTKNELTKKQQKTLEELIKKGGLSADPEQLKKEIEALSELLKNAKDPVEMLRKLTEKKEGDSNNGNPQTLSKKQLSELQRLMKRSQQKKLSENLAKRQEQLDNLNDFLDEELDKLAECKKKCGQCQGGSCKGNGGSCPAGNKPGKGNITRGRGDAAISYGDESTKDDTKFKESILPPGMLDKPRDESVGVSASVPEVKPADSAPRSRARKNNPSSGRETWSRELRPRHRKVVRKYFNDK